MATVKVRSTDCWWISMFNLMTLPIECPLNANIRSILSNVLLAEKIDDGKSYVTYALLTFRYYPFSCSSNRAKMRFLAIALVHLPAFDVYKTYIWTDRRTTTLTSLLRYLRSLYYFAKNPITISISIYVCFHLRVFSPVLIPIRGIRTKYYITCAQRGQNESRSNTIVLIYLLFSFSSPVPRAYPTLRYSNW